MFSQIGKKDPRADFKYKYTRTDRFNPITGESKANTSFGFEDYLPEKEKKYKANNHTRIPYIGQNYDIISGRKLTYGWYDDMIIFIYQFCKMEEQPLIWKSLSWAIWQMQGQQSAFIAAVYFTQSISACWSFPFDWAAFWQMASAKCKNIYHG